MTNNVEGAIPPAENLFSQQLRISTLVGQPEGIDQISDIDLVKLKLATVVAEDQEANLLQSSIELTNAGIQETVLQLIEHYDIGDPAVVDSVQTTFEHAASEVINNLLNAESGTEEFAQAWRDNPGLVSQKYLPKLLEVLEPLIPELQDFRRVDPFTDEESYAGADQLIINTYKGENPKLLLAIVQQVGIRLSNEDLRGNKLLNLDLTRLEKAAKLVVELASRLANITWLSTQYIRAEAEQHPENGAKRLQKENLTSFDQMVYLKAKAATTKGVDEIRKDLYQHISESDRAKYKVEEPTYA